MNAEPNAHPESVNACLAKYLDTQKEAILSEWRKRVRADMTIAPTRSLSPSALTNRLPLILDDLAASLRRYGSRPVADQAVRNAEEHGATRWSQGYEVPEMLRELKHLRHLLIYHLRIFEDLHPDVGMASALFVSTAVHGFLDDVAADAVREFLWSQLSRNDKIQRGRLTWEGETSRRPVAGASGLSPWFARTSVPGPSGGGLG